jgi:hypothetical protein
MSKRIFLSVYEREQDILEAAAAVRKLGHEIEDIYAPYAVHGLEHVAGFRRSRLPIVCFFLGLSGAALMMWFQYYTNIFDWPVNVGGKPWNRWPAFLPPTFEVTVLLAGVGTVLTLFVRQGLWPGKQARIPVEGVTDNRFALLVVERDATFDFAAMSDLCRRHNAVLIEEREEETR